MLRVSPASSAPLFKPELIGTLRYVEPDANPTTGTPMETELESTDEAPREKLKAAGRVRDMASPPGTGCKNWVAVSRRVTTAPAISGHRGVRVAFSTPRVTTTRAEAAMMEQPVVEVRMS